MLETPLTKLKNDQIEWYTLLLIKMVLVDGRISPNEINYVKTALNKVGDSAIKQKLINHLEEKDEPGLLQPPGIPKDTLATIYMELIHIALSDQEIHSDERQLLINIARLFDFYPKYTKECLQWADDGISIRALQEKIIGSRIPNEEKIVPLSRLNTEQKKWYIDAIISALIHEGIKEDREINLLRRVFESTPSKEEQQMLRQHILQRHRPPIKRPPNMPEKALLMILMEVVLISIRQGEMGYQAQQHLKLLTDVSRISAVAYNNMMDWVKQSLSWKRREQDLIHNVRLNSSREEEEARKKGILVTHPENNAIQVRKVHCFVCGSGNPIPLFQLKHLSQKTSQNIFGIPLYGGANEGFDPVDFNLIRVIVCPSCLFASVKKEHFLRDKKEKPPEGLAEPRFKEEWMSHVLDREERIEGMKNAMSSIARPPRVALASYRLAIDSLLSLDEHFPSELTKGQIINLRLTIAEIMMEYNMKQDAEEELALVMDLAIKLYRHGKDDQLALKATRVLLIGSLFFKEERDAQDYIEFFHKFKTDKADGYKIEDRQLFQKLYGEVTQIYAKRELYAKEKLKGFRLDLGKSQPAPKQTEEKS